MPQQSAQRFARHLPSGNIWDANEVDMADRDGPWACVVDGCPVVYDAHRRPSVRFRGDKPENVSGSFVIRGAASHNLALTHERIPQRSTNQQTDANSRLNIHRLTGLASEQIRTRADTGEPTGLTRTQYVYGFSIDTAAGLIDFARAIENEPSLAITERIRFGDTHYTWADLSYTASRASFVRLFDRIRSQINPGRVYFIQGVVKYHAWIDNVDPELLLLRVMSDLENFGEELWIFMPNEGRFSAIVGNLAAGDRIALVANRLVLNRNRPALSIVEPHQLELLPTI